MKIKNTLITISALLLSSTVTVIAQPSNDEKESASSITTKYNCDPGFRDYYDFDLSEATGSGNEVDVWYKFTASNLNYEFSYNYKSGLYYEVLSDETDAEIIYDGQTFKVPELNKEYYIRLVAETDSKPNYDQPFCFIGYPGNWTKEEAKVVTEETDGTPKANAFDGSPYTGPDFICNEDNKSVTHIWYKFTAESDSYEVETRINSSMYYYVEILDENEENLYCGTGGSREKMTIETEAGKTYYIHAGKLSNSADRTFGVSITSKGEKPAVEDPKTEIAEVFVAGDESPAISISPNPAKNILSILNAYQKKYSIVNQEGSVIKTGIINGQSVDISGLSIGAYTLNIDGNSLMFVKTK